VEIPIHTDTPTVELNPRRNNHTNSSNSRNNKNNYPVMFSHRPVPQRQLALQ
jgi:hypothetical protein